MARTLVSLMLLATLVAAASAATAIEKTGHGPSAWTSNSNIQLGSINAKFEGAETKEGDRKLLAAQIAEVQTKVHGSAPDANTLNTINQQASNYNRKLQKAPLYAVDAHAGRKQYQTVFAADQPVRLGQEGRIAASGNKRMLLKANQPTSVGASASGLNALFGNTNALSYSSNEKAVKNSGDRRLLALRTKPNKDSTKQVQSTLYQP